MTLRMQAFMLDKLEKIAQLYHYELLVNYSAGSNVGYISVLDKTAIKTAVLMRFDFPPTYITFKERGRSRDEWLDNRRESHRIELGDDTALNGFLDKFGERLRTARGH